MIFSGFTGRARLGLLLLCAAGMAGCGGDNRSPGPSVFSAQSGNPSVTQGGRLVVFESASSVVVVDRVNATSLVIGQNDAIANSVVTPDGRFVAFDAQPAGVATRQVFLRDLTTGETTLVSASSPDVPGNGTSTNPSISDDGRFVAFQSNAVDLGARSASSSSVLVSEVSLGAIRSASTFSDGDDLNPAISGNGQFVAFESQPLEGFSQVLLSNQRNGQLTPVSGVESGAAPNGSSGEPSLNFDGRFVAFESRATNLTPPSPGTGAFAGEANIVVRDVLTGTLVAATSSLTPGTPADGDSRHPTISRDGRRVAFESTATNLTADIVQPGESNVFVRDLSDETTELVTQPAPVPPPPQQQPPPSGLTTSTPVQPIAPTGGLVTSAPVLPGPDATGVPTPPPPEDPVATGATAVPTPGVASGLITQPPVQPIAPTGALVTSVPVQPIAPTGALVTSVPVQPIAPTGALVTSVPVQPIAPVSGLVTSAPVQPIAPVSGLVTSAPVGTAGTTDTSTGATVVLNAVAPAGSRRPSISPDGAWVAFESRGGIFLADLKTKAVSRITAAR